MHVLSTNTGSSGHNASLGHACSGTSGNTSFVSQVPSAFPYGGTACTDAFGHGPCGPAFHGLSGYTAFHTGSSGYGPHGPNALHGHTALHTGSSGYGPYGSNALHGHTALHTDYSGYGPYGPNAFHGPSDGQHHAQDTNTFHGLSGHTALHTGSSGYGYGSNALDANMFHDTYSGFSAYWPSFTGLSDGRAARNVSHNDGPSTPHAFHDHRPLYDHRPFPPFKQHTAMQPQPLATRTQAPRHQPTDTAYVPFPTSATLPLTRTAQGTTLTPASTPVPALADALRAVLDLPAASFASVLAPDLKAVTFQDVPFHAQTDIKFPYNWRCAPFVPAAARLIALADRAHTNDAPGNHTAPATQHLHNGHITAPPPFERTCGNDFHTCAQPGTFPTPHHTPAAASGRTHRLNDDRVTDPDPAPQRAAAIVWGLTLEDQFALFSTGKPANMSNSAFKNITRGVRLRLLAHRKYGTPFDDILQPSVIHGTPFNDALCPVAPPPLPPRGAQPPPNAGSVSAASTLNDMLHPSAQPFRNASSCDGRGVGTDPALPHVTDCGAPTVWDMTLEDQFELFSAGKPATMSKSAFKNITRGVRLRLLAHRKYGTPFDDILRSPVVHGAAFDNAFCSAASSPLPPHGLQPPPSASAGFVFDASTLPSVPFHQTMADQFRLFASGKPADWSNSVFKQATRGVRLRLLAHHKYGQPLNDMLQPSAQLCRNASPALPTVATLAPVACHGLPSRGTDAASHAPLSSHAFHASHDNLAQRLRRPHSSQRPHVSQLAPLPALTRTPWINPWADLTQEHRLTQDCRPLPPDDLLNAPRMHRSSDVDATTISILLAEPRQMHFGGMSPLPVSVIDVPDPVRVKRFNRHVFHSGPKPLSRSVIPWPGKSVKATTIPQTAYERSSPLHSKRVRAMNYDAIKKLARGTPVEAKLTELLKWNTSEDYYRHISQDSSSDAPKCPLPQEYIDKLVGDDNVELIDPSLVMLVGDDNVKRIDPSLVMRFASLFTVYEEAKHRQRVILWPKTLNELVDYVSGFSLPSVRDQLSHASLATWAVCFDLTASFYQAELDPAVRKFFCFLGPDGNTYRFKRMVMGFAPAPEIMHTILQVVVAHVLSQFADVTATSYIDNVRFMHDCPTRLSQCARLFRDTCVLCGITLNEEPLNVPHQQGIFLGIAHDYAKGLSALTDKSREKLRKARLALFGDRATIADVLHAFGLLFFASSVLNFPLASVYHIFKYYRRKAVQLNNGTISENSPALLWRCLHKPLGAWFDFFDDKARTAPTRLEANGSVSLFTDACLTGAGAVLFTDDGQVLTWSRKFTPLESSRRIEELEAIAASEAFAFFAADMAGKKVTLHIDNTSVLGALRKGHSPSFNLNRHITDLAVKTRVLLVDLKYVRSEHNPSDVESRRYAKTPALNSTQLRRSPEGLDKFQPTLRVLQQ